MARALSREQSAVASCKESETELRKRANLPLASKEWVKSSERSSGRKPWGKEREDGPLKLRCK